MQPTCNPQSPPAPSGGIILEGVYALVTFQIPVCLDLEQTLRFTQTGTDPVTFEVESVLNFGDTHANSVMVVDGTTLISTPTCGNEDPEEIISYSTFEGSGVDYLRLHEDTNVFVYERVGD